MSKRSFVVALAAACVATLAGAGTVRAQEHEGHEMPQMSAEEMAMMEAMERAGTPGPQHAMLAGMAGDWTFEGKFWMSPDQEPMAASGTATRTMIMGGRVLVEKVTSSYMGQPFEGQGMLGYDNVAGSYWSTWIDNMSTALMTSTGSCDDQGKCEWHATYTDPMTGQQKTARMTSEHGADTELHRSYEAGEGGAERLSMEFKYTRAR
jgi:hypothetical protein